MMGDEENAEENEEQQNNNNTIQPPEWSRYLNHLYYDARQPGSFQSFNKLHKSTTKEGRYQVGVNRLRRWLQNQEPYSRNRLFLPNRIKRSRVFVGGLKDQYDADLADYQKFEDSNDGYKYLLVIINVFSRYTWAIPVKSKSNRDIIPAFETIFQQGHIPRRLRTDQGKEFTAPIMDEFYRHYNITHFVALNEVKANYAERVIKTLKSKLARYMTYHQTSRYIDALDDIVTSYNATFHKTIGIAPKEVNASNESVLWWKQYQPNHHIDNKNVPPTFKFKVGDYVRIPHLSTVFGREWRARWTQEIFTITESFRRDNINMYKVQDEDKEEVFGTFYEGELQRVLQDQENQWRVERIIKQRGRGAFREAFVKFKGWPTFYNEWIPFGRAQRDLNSQRN